MVKAMLMYTAQPLRGYNLFEQGAGQINVAGAVTLSQLTRKDITASMTLGTQLFTQAPPLGMTIGYTTISGYTFTWARGIILNHTFATGASLALYQKIYAQGVLMGDCEIQSNGVLMGDTTKVTQGVLMGDQIMTSDGTMLGRGTIFVGAGVLMGDGILMGDGVLIGDGILMGDGVLVSDGILMGDSVAANASASLLNGDNTSAMVIVRDSGTSNFNY
jgi:hypothetical protein